MEKTIARLQQLINQKLDEESYGQSPQELYEPIRYIMALGGKRLRPMLVLLGYSLFKDDPESVVDQALAIEVFHNFTLMHDDIMDEAPLRRGQETVHIKWNPNTAILSGDVMLVKAYDLLLATPKKHLREALQVFNKCAREVCEGQQMDMVFETRDEVTEGEYVEMIRLKTAVLLGASLELGALLAGASEKDRKQIREFGEKIGIGFQLKDDLLDVYGDAQKFGKQVGGDIIANKKTYLLIQSLRTAGMSDRKELQRWLLSTDFNPDSKVAAVKSIYDNLGIREAAEEKMNTYFEEGFSALKRINCDLTKRSKLREFAESLISRQS